MSTRATCAFLIKIIGIGPKLLIDLLRPFDNQLPATDQEFEEFKTAIRRNYNILEHEPMNIGHAMQDGHGKEVSRMTANYAEADGYESVGVYTAGMLHTMGEDGAVHLRSTRDGAGNGGHFIGTGNGSS